MPRPPGVKLDPATVERARRHRLITRRELAERAGVGDYTVWCAFNGWSISLANARRVAKALRVSLRSLVVEAAEGDKGAELKVVTGVPGKVKVG